MRTAILFGVAGVAMLAACGGTQGTTESVGQSGEAISVSHLSSGTFNIPSATQFSASCVIRDKHASPNVDYVLYVGGFSNLGTAMTDAWLLNPSSGWTTSSNFLGTGNGRGNARMIKDPRSGHENECYLVGGSTDLAGSTTVANSVRIYIDSSTGTLSKDSPVSMNVGRSKFALLPCVTDKIVAIGGKTGASSATKVLEVFDPASPAWTQYTTTASQQLGVGRFDLGVSPNATGTAGGVITAVSTQKFVAVGGNDGSGVTRRVDLIDMGSSCSAPSVTSANNILGTGRDRLIAIPEGHTDKIMVAGGDNGGSLNTVETLTVNWGATPPTVSSSGTSTPANFLATRAPSLAAEISSGLPVSYLLVSGDSDTGTGGTLQTLAQILKYVPGTGWTNTTTGVTDRIGAPAEFLGGFVYTTAGKTLTNGTASYPQTTDKITP